VRPYRIALAAVLAASAAVAQGTVPASRPSTDSAPLTVAHRDARLILAQSLHALGETGKAEEQAKLATERFPDHPGGFILLGRIEFDRFIVARDEAQQAQKGSKEQAEALQRAATARDAARQRFERAVAIDPMRAFPFIKLGDLEAWQGRVPQALEAYAKALSIDPLAAVSHSWIKQNAADAREPFYAKLVEAWAQDASKKPERGATLLWYHGAALTDKKQWKLARQRFEAAVLANPSFQNSWYWAANAAFWDGDHDAAMKDALAYATANTPGFADLLKSLSEAERDEGMRVLRFLAGRAYEKNLHAGSRDLNHVIALIDEKPESWNNYAFLCRETGKFQDSLDAYVHALEIEPDSPQLLNDAAVILQYHLATKDNLAKARTWYEKALVCADKVLADPKADQEQKRRAQQARQDASANLAKLK
jgi:tetratricopeptide (TPR) repeat protein